MKTIIVGFPAISKKEIDLQLFIAIFSHGLLIYLIQLDFKLFEKFTSSFIMFTYRKCTSMHTISIDTIKISEKIHI